MRVINSKVIIEVADIERLLKKSKGQSIQLLIKMREELGKNDISLTDFSKYVGIEMKDLFPDKLNNRN